MTVSTSPLLRTHRPLHRRRWERPAKGRPGRRTPCRTLAAKERTSGRRRREVSRKTRPMTCPVTGRQTGRPRRSPVQTRAAASGVKPGVIALDDGRACGSIAHRLPLPPGMRASRVPSAVRAPVVQAVRGRTQGVGGGPASSMAGDGGKSTLRSNGRLAPRGTLGSEALEHLAAGSDRHDGGHDRDPVLLGEVGPVADIHLE